ncbi:SDR family NAD(P)-dependent oxidoreductase [Algicola sagamiensis]|uniref:SDR family NAD(P)-dependent oxidoreductase n=1 Tax=Algicola sagamiensis TaxID=163869 RepID=UPI0003738676|nr:SDR family NAD(P)-dependent oxidoreductase [Algicola sagamiensis]
MKTYFITGATSGIGRQLAMDYAASGAKVIACGRREEKLKELESYSTNIQGLCFDITDQMKVNQAIHSVKTHVDVWILNAGDCEYIDDGRIEAKLFRRVFEVNFFGVVHCLEAIQERVEPGDQVALMSSTASYIPLPRAEAYGASKSAISYLARSLAIDWAGIEVNISVISPGFVKTPLTDKNTFAMPMRISAEEASVAIQKGLAKREREIHFPKRFSYLLKSISLLPQFIQFKLGCKIGAQ